MTTPKTPTPRLGLFVQEDTQYGTYRIRAHVVTLGPTPSNKDLSDNQIRNASEESPQAYGGLYLRDLEALAYGHEWATAERPDCPRTLSFYGPLAYDTHRVTRREALKMAHTLQTIEKRLAKLVETQGHPESFGAYLAQLGTALRAKSMVFKAERGLVGGHSFDDTEYRITNLGDGAAQVNYYARQWVETGRAVKDAA